MVGLPVERVGSAAGPPGRGAGVSGNYDLVFAKGRCALEAAAVGAAVILCDIQGLGRMVTSETVAGMYAWNFGMRNLSRPIAPLLIATENPALQPVRRRQSARFLHSPQCQPFGCRETIPGRLSPGLII